MKNNLKSKVFGLTLAAALAIGVLAGCDAAPAQQPGEEAGQGETPAVGSVLLSVNPEIEIEYDKEGKVVELDGVNEDGLNIVGSCSDYLGRPVKEVARELVTKIDEAGYFDSTIAGHEKNIVIKLDPESDALDDGFLESIAEEIRLVVSERSIGSSALAIDTDDYDDDHKAQGYINAETAQELLRTQLQREDIQFVEKEYDIDDGTYEIEFVLDGQEYEYEVNAATGKVIEMDADDIDDDRDDVDDDLDDDDDRDDVNDDMDDDDDRDDVDDDMDDDDDRDDVDDDADDDDDRDDSDDDDND